MTIYGVTPTGFVPKTLDDCKTELEQDLQGAFGASIDLAPQGVFGQFVGIMAERESELWDVLQAVYSSNDPDQATGQALDNVCALDGVYRNSPEPSTTILTCTGTPGTVLNSGRNVNVQSTGATFVTQATVTITLVPTWTNGMTVSTIGQRVTSGGWVFQAVQTGVSGATPPSPLPFGQVVTTGGTELWETLGQGTGAIDVAADCNVDGPVPALAGTCNIIGTPVSGWSNVINFLDAILGSLTEDDAALRVRRDEELFDDAAATLSAIRERILKVDENTDNPVTNCTVFANSTLVTDANGLPPKSFEVVATGGVDADIAAAILEAGAAGIQTHGTTTILETDAGGNAVLVSFSRPNQRLIYVTLNVEVDTQVFDASVGPANIIAQVVTWALGYYTLGKGVASNIVAAHAYIAGVENVIACFIDTAPNPVSSTTITAAPRDQCMFDSSRIIVNIVAGSEGNP